MTSTIPICDDCKKILTKTPTGYKCHSCKTCPECLGTFIDINQQLTCNGCGLISNTLKFDFLRNLTHDEKVQLDVTNKASSKRHFASIGSQLATKKLVERAPKKLQKLAIGEEEYNMDVYSLAVTQAIHGNPDLQELDDAVLTKLHQVTLMYIATALTEMENWHVGGSRNTSVVAVTMLLFSLRAHKAATGIDDQDVIDFGYNEECGMSLKTFRKRVLTLYTTIKRNNLIDSTMLLDESSHRQNVFQRWASKFEIPFKDVKPLWQLVEKSLTDVWLGGRMFEFYTACIIRHVYITGCPLLQLQPIGTPEEVREKINQVLSVQWKTLAKGCETVAVRHGCATSPPS